MCFGKFEFTQIHLVVYFLPCKQDMYMCVYIYIYIYIHIYIYIYFVYVAVLRLRHLVGLLHMFVYPGLSTHCRPLPSEMSYA